MQIRQPLREVQKFQEISQKLIKLECCKSVYPMVFMDKDCNKDGFIHKVTNKISHICSFKFYENILK